MGLLRGRESESMHTQVALSASHLSKDKRTSEHHPQGRLEVTGKGHAHKLAICLWILSHQSTIHLRGCLCEGLQRACIPSKAGETLKWHAATPALNALIANGESLKWHAATPALHPPNQSTAPPLWQGRYAPTSFIPTTSFIPAASTIPKATLLTAGKGELACSTNTYSGTNTMQHAQPEHL
eukprot:scaffold212862_cov20-Tisochrysis_lutea.AAC.1